jgi:hypothetical protein
MIRVEAIYEHLGECDSETYVRECMVEDDRVSNVEIIGSTPTSWGIVNVHFQVNVVEANSVAVAEDVLTSVLNDSLLNVEVAP